MEANQVLDDSAMRSQQLAQQSGVQFRPTPLQPLIRQIEKRVFVCTMQNASMHRADGKKIPFVRGYLMTDVTADIAYLDNEIASGNTFIRAGTPDDVLNCEAIYDPLTHIKSRVLKEMEPRLREELTDQIRREFQQQIDDLKKLAGVDGVVTSGQQQTVHVARLNPVSSSDIAAATNGRAPVAVPPVQTNIPHVQVTADGPLNLSPAARAAAASAAIVAARLNAQK